MPYIPADVGVGCLLPAKLDGGNAREVGESCPPKAPARVEELEVFRLCIDFEVAIRRRDSVPEATGVPKPALTGVSPSTAIAARLWHDIRFAKVFKPILFTVSAAFSHFQ